MLPSHLTSSDVESSIAAHSTIAEYKQVRGIITETKLIKQRTPFEWRSWFIAAMKVWRG